MSGDEPHGSAAPADPRGQPKGPSDSPRRPPAGNAAPIPGGPRFLSDEELKGEIPPAPTAQASGPGVEAVADALPRGPTLLDPEPDAPRQLSSEWAPGDIATARRRMGTASWIAGGLGVLVASWAVFSMLSFLMAQFEHSLILGILASAGVSVGLGMVGYAGAMELRSYRSLAEVRHLKETFGDPRLPVEALRVAGLDWLGRITHEGVDTAAIQKAVREAETPAEVRAILRNRLVGRLQELARQIGRRAALDGAALVAVCPYPAWDGLIAGGRGLHVIRQVAALYGVRPGMAVTMKLVRNVAWTAAGTAGVDVVAQTLANSTLQDLPVVKQIAGAVPEASVTAIRLYRLANVTAVTCCPLSQLMT